MTGGEGGGGRVPWLAPAHCWRESLHRSELDAAMTLSQLAGGGHTQTWLVGVTGLSASHWFILQSGRPLLAVIYNMWPGDKWWLVTSSMLLYIYSVLCDRSRFAIRSFKL